MPKVVHVLAAGIFAMVTSEFTVSGLMPQLAHSLGTGVEQIGYLVSVFALSMAIGGPLLASALLRFSHRRALLALFAVFFVGNIVAALTPSYSILLLARIVTGAASGAFFGIAVTAAGNAVSPELRGRATAAVLQGLALGTTLGLPMATWTGGHFGWRAAFVAIGALTLAAAGATAATMPDLAPTADAPNLRNEALALRSPHLWLVLATSTLIIGATFAGFSYFTPILNTETGIDLGVVPLLLVAYGVTTVAGNAVVGRLAISHTMIVLVAGTAMAAMFLALFASGAQSAWIAVPAMLGIGFVGVTMNPAMVTRVQRVGGTGALVNTVHTSMITLGIVIGSALGGIGTAAFGLRAPLWIGAAMAAVAVAVMVPALLVQRRTEVPA
ncbi:MFS transporter [Rhodococcus sp. P1Y]|uniref:MFS transporter n=1 Tax=Rhodococcus sp. P1Y TaxID=1302308 RepID=UPI000EB2BE35|nr:MFS transporter [Rhodococcus sp. P1Y]AYJ47379.1 MFS transporter [Rhodococcus sp. P1Y]